MGRHHNRWADAEQRTLADGLAGRICAAAAEAARSSYVLLELLGEFDATHAIRYWTGFKSLAHWLSWSCSMNPGVAREHVRVAKALRRLPTIAGLFAVGRLSYSKVREVTRVVDVVDEERLAELTLTATASQLARMISGFRSADGLRIKQQIGRNVSWREREDGMVELRARLPKEEDALLLAAINTARDQLGRHHLNSTRAVRPNRSLRRVWACTAVLMRCWMWPAAFLQTAPEDRSGEDRTLVVQR
ncbi:MAG TPA: DUF222 domain-containing protein [Propionibacteriaceae bacterium]|nr:DUF222 domain-containing protein [Propionibacteriaceae bacterium]